MKTQCNSEEQVQRSGSPRTATIGGRIGKTFLVFLALIALLLAFLFSGVPVRIDFLDTRIESVVSRMLARRVAIDGPVRARFSLHPDGPLRWPRWSCWLYIFND